MSIDTIVTKLNFNTDYTSKCPLCPLLFAIIFFIIINIFFFFFVNSKWCNYQFNLNFVPSIVNITFYSNIYIFLLHIHYLLLLLLCFVCCHINPCRTNSNIYGCNLIACIPVYNINQVGF